MQLRCWPILSWTKQAANIIQQNFNLVENVLNGHVDNSNLEGGIPTSKLAVDTIQWTVDIPIIVNGQSIDASTVGAKVFPSSTLRLDAASIKHLKSAKLIVDYVWAATADGKLQLFDETANAVRGESSAKTGGESFEWEEFSVSDLASASTMRIRADITTAGASGETVMVYRAFLRLTLGVS